MPMRKMVRVYWMNINTDGCLITQINLPFTIEIIGTSMYLFLTWHPILCGMLENTNQNF